MLTIIIGIALAVGVFLFFLKSISAEPEQEDISYYYDETNDDFSAFAAIFIPLILIGISMLLGICCPLQGYSDPLIEKESLVSFLNEDEVYLLEFENKYLYKIVSSKYEEKGNIYETKTISACDAKKQELENCEQPVFIISERKPVSGIWTFALCNSKKEYMFEVPKNTIRYGINSEEIGNMD